MTIGILPPLVFLQGGFVPSDDVDVESLRYSKPTLEFIEGMAKAKPGDPDVELRLSPPKRR
jgi:hypothetical protein